MNLKKIELYGFKSFADRLVIDFKSNITAIVGPNGCGKSNFADAVRWVLGEQSPSVLRCKKMSEVIFSGTTSRRSLSYCEVSLYLDNEQKLYPVDYDEVVITRKLYRNGESEYYINKNVCRLKDIIDLFRDSGIGREGYSI
ncbi:MAG: AAA family ATPase, partial [Clostridia bacterium]